MGRYRSNDGLDEWADLDELLSDEIESESKIKDKLLAADDDQEDEIDFPEESGRRGFLKRREAESEEGANERIKREQSARRGASARTKTAEVATEPVGAIGTATEPKEPATGRGGITIRRRVKSTQPKREEAVVQNEKNEIDEAFLALDEPNILDEPEEKPKRRRKRKESSWREMMSGLLGDDKEEKEEPKKEEKVKASLAESTEAKKAEKVAAEVATNAEEKVQTPAKAPTKVEAKRKVEMKQTRMQRVISMGTGKKKVEELPERGLKKNVDEVEMSVDEEVTRNTFTENPRPKITAEQAREMQDRLMLTYLLGRQVMEKRNLEVNEHDKMIVLSRIRDGKFTAEDSNEILRTIDEPARKYGDDGIFRRINGNEKERRILAYEMGLGFRNFEQTDGVVVAQFRKKFPLPSDFAAAADGFLKIIRKNTSDKTYREYIEAMEDFKWQVYGERQIYFDQMKILDRRAEQKMISRDGLKGVDTVEMKKILRRTQIEGSAWIDGRIERKLTSQILLRNGLGPRWKVDIGGVELGLSQAFAMAKREVVLAYTNVSGMTKVMSYYRDTADGIWRYLPDYTMRRMNGGKIGIFCGVGYAEESLMLPAELQMRLSEISEEKSGRGIMDQPEFLFAGTAKRYDKPGEYLAARREWRLTGRVYEEVEMKPTVVFGEKSKYKTNPTELVINDEGASPDFSKVEFSWEMKTGRYGRITANSFMSKDRTLIYTFCEDALQRAWLVAVEVATSAVTSTGLRAEWVYPGDLATPIYVPVKKSDEYGDDKDIKGGYIAMWKKYVGRIPMVREYLRSKLDRK